ncbi:MAG: valine--tRNA ligase [Bdellovibrionales bacterium]|nr:valine--tRNA ligase [Bdellovibrionales bacterium]
MKKKLLDEVYYQKKWEKENTYSYNLAIEKKNTFVIDTPPPTISGALHIGHVFSYTQTDILARFQRMQGKNIFYPMGWDNNGLPTERRVQNLYKITCDPAIPNTDKAVFEELLVRKKKQKLSGFLPVSRKTFVNICSKQTKEDQKSYEKLWRSLSLSVDWHQTYETISPHSQMLAQQSFLDLYKKGFVENRHIPVFWDTQFKTAVAQADMEDRKRKGFYHDIKFQIENGKESFVISTTRPELLPACVAIAAHPQDERYKKFFHKQAVTPVFSSSVPILPSPHADPEKGTGILMICTFGDMEDVHFWKKHKLALKQVISQDGFFKSLVFESLLGNKISASITDKEKAHTGKTNTFLSIQPDQANRYYKELAGLRVQQARKKIVEILVETKHLVSEPQVTEQFVKFYEKGDYPLELIPARQWYIQILKYKKELLEQGRKIKWHPLFMLKRYEQWVEGLNQDWCISRQRFFGVPFPVWYPLDKNKTPDYKNPILPIETKEKDISVILDKPVDPISSAPSDWNSEFKHYTEEQREKAGGFTADIAVMDTWATSSLTPQISSHWGQDKERHRKLFPADLRPQAHEIIRTWAFYTIVKSFFHESDVKKNIPWKHIAISGWVMNPDKLKMSKSKGGNITSPEELIEEYSADAIRYWAGKARLGMDTVYDENMFKTGKKLVIKLNNAFKFLQIQIKGMNSFFMKYQKEESITENNSSFPGVEKSLSRISTAIDKAWLIYLRNIQQQASSYLEHFHYSQALDIIEKSFWLFCDNYLELVKGRAYQFTHFESFVLKAGAEGKVTPEEIKKAQSAVGTLDLSIYIFVKMLAPYMPYITEHIWSQRYAVNPKGFNGRTDTKQRPGEEKNISVHRSSWILPSSFVSHLETEKNKNRILFNSDKFLNFSFNLLEKIRSYKASQKKSLSTSVKELKIKLNKEGKVSFYSCQEDLAKATHTKKENIFIEEVKEKGTTYPEISIILESD